MNLRRTIKELSTKFLVKEFFNQTMWGWISTDDKLIQVPKLNHKGYIMNKYKNENFGWDYDRVFDEAIKDGWVRIIIEKQPNFKTEISINGYNKERLADVITKFFKDEIKYGNNVFYIDYESPKESHIISNQTVDGKIKLNNLMK